MKIKKSTQVLLDINATLIIGIVLLIFTFIIYNSLPFASSVKQLITDDSWHPIENKFNVLPMILGSLIITMLAVLIAAPAGVIVAITIYYFSNNIIRKICIQIIEMLTSIPSVIYGFWGLVTLVPFVNLFAPPGTSIFTASIVLAMMVLPLMVLVAVNAFQNLPKSHWENGYALGLSKFSIIKKIVLKVVWLDLFSGAILQIGRAAGETIAVLMVCGNVVNYPSSIFSSTRTLTANIALEMPYAMGKHYNALFVCGLLLLIFITFIFLITNNINKRYSQ